MQKRKLDSERRGRVEKNELLSMLFELFKEHKEYDLETLTEETNQPQQYVKEVLEEICDFSKKGKAKGMYSLKKEYQTVV